MTAGFAVSACEVESLADLDLELPLEEAPAGYAAMDQRTAIKALLQP